MKYEHVYIKINGQEYYDYTLYTDKSVTQGWRIIAPPHQQDYDFIVDQEVMQQIDSVQYSNSVKPPRGSSLYITPGCTFALDDVRKHYTIKRKYDTGDYNVVQNLKINYRHTPKIDIESIIVSVVNKAIFTHSSIISLPEGYIPDDNLHAHHNVGLRLSFIKAPDIYKAILDKTVVKPIVKDESLDITSDVPLTADVLLLVYNSAVNRNVSFYDRVKNTILQIQSLNQHNWQNYQGTVSLLLGRILNDGGVVSHMIRRRNSLPKEVKNILSDYTRSYYEFSPISEEDYYFCQEFIKYLLHMNDIQFASFSSVYDKLKKFNLTRKHFESLFNPVVRITTRSYEDFSETKK